MLIRDRHIDPDSSLVKRTLSIAVAPAINLTNGVVALIKAHDHAMRLLGARVYARTKAGAVAFNLAICGADGLIVPGLLAIDAVPEKFKLITTTVIYLSSSVAKSKAPATTIAFSAAYTINNAGAAGLFYGAFLVQVDAAGAVTTKTAGGANDQAYATSAAAIAALPVADATKVALGYIVVKTKTTAVKWTATVDDMTDGSDCTTTTFTNYAARTPLSAALTPLAAEAVEGALDVSATTEYQAEVDEYIAVICTSDGTGALVDGRLELSHRAARVYRNE